MHLADLVHPRGEDQFLQSSFGKDLCVIPGTEGRFEHLLSWSDISRILRFNNVSHVINLFKEGQEIPVGSYTEVLRMYPDQPRYWDRTQHRVSPALVRAHLFDGASLIIHSLEELHEPIADLAKNLEKAFQERVYINAYISWGHTNGFKMHWDDHDVLILQVAGKKHWEIHPPSQEFPMRGSEPPLFEPGGVAAAEITISSGHVLHVPRGWWHLVTPVNEPSIHLNIGTTQRTGVHLLSWLSDEMRKETAFRKDIPRRQDKNAQIEYLRDLQETLGKYLNDHDVLDKYFMACGGSGHMRPAFNLLTAADLDPETAGDEIALSWQAPLATIWKTADETIVEISGRRHAFPERAAEVLHRLATGEPCRMSEISESLIRLGLDEETAEEVLHDLIDWGLVAVM